MDFVVNSISLDPEVKDAWGLPAMRTTFKNHSDDLSTTHFLEKQMPTILEAAGARKIGSDPETITDTGYSRHRMSADPARSVVNSHHSSSSNGSSFVTSGQPQPTDHTGAISPRGRPDDSVRLPRRDPVETPEVPESVAGDVHSGCAVEAT